jgi:hypothetical protein
MISLQTSYRFDNCHCAGRAKDGDEQQVALHRRKTTTKRSQRRERDELPYPWVPTGYFSFCTYFGGAPTRRGQQRVGFRARNSEQMVSEFVARHVSPM